MWNLLLLREWSSNLQLIQSSLRVETKKKKTPPSHLAFREHHRDKSNIRDFPNLPAFKTPCSQGRGCKFDHYQGTKIPQATQCSHKKREREKYFSWEEETILGRENQYQTIEGGPLSGKCVKQESLPSSLVLVDWNNSHLEIHKSIIDHYSADLVLVWPRTKLSPGFSWDNSILVHVSLNFLQSSLVAQWDSKKWVEPFRISWSLNQPGILLIVLYSTD